jgi:hypothetical protein
MSGSISLEQRRIDIHNFKTLMENPSAQFIVDDEGKLQPDPPYFSKWLSKQPKKEEAKKVRELLLKLLDNLKKLAKEGKGPLQEGNAEAVISRIFSLHAQYTDTAVIKKMWEIKLLERALNEKMRQLTPEIDNNADVRLVKAKAFSLGKRINNLQAKILEHRRRETATPDDLKKLENKLSGLKRRKERKDNFAEVFSKVLIGQKMGLTCWTGYEKGLLKRWSGSFQFRDPTTGERLGVYKPSDQDSMSWGSPNPIAKIRWLWFSAIFYIARFCNNRSILLSQSGVADINEGAAYILAEELYEAAMNLKPHDRERPGPITPYTDIVSMNFKTDREHVNGKGSFQLFVKNNPKDLNKALNIHRETYEPLESKEGQPARKMPADDFEMLKVDHYLQLSEDDHGENTMIDDSGFLWGVDNGQSFNVRSIQGKKTDGTTLNWLYKRFIQCSDTGTYSLKPMLSVQHSQAEAELSLKMREFVIKFAEEGYLEKTAKRLRAYYQNPRNYPGGKPEDPYYTEKRIRLFRERYELFKQELAVNEKPLNELENHIFGRIEFPEMEQLHQLFPKMWEGSITGSVRCFHWLNTLPLDPDKLWTHEDLQGFYNLNRPGIRRSFYDPKGLIDEAKQFLAVAQKLLRTPLGEDEDIGMRDSWLKIASHLQASIEADAKLSGVVTDKETLSALEDLRSLKAAIEDTKKELSKTGKVPSDEEIMHNLLPEEDEATRDLRRKAEKEVAPTRGKTYFSNYWSRVHSVGTCFASAISSLATSATRACNSFWKSRTTRKLHDLFDNVDDRPTDEVLQSAMRGFHQLEKLHSDDNKLWTREEMQGFYNRDQNQLTEDVQQFLKVTSKLGRVKLGKDATAMLNAWKRIGGHLVTSIFWNMQTVYPKKDPWNSEVAGLIEIERRHLEEEGTNHAEVEKRSLRTGERAFNVFWGDVRRTYNRLTIQDLTAQVKDPQAFEEKETLVEQNQSMLEVLQTLADLSPGKTGGTDPDLLAILQIMTIPSNFDLVTLLTNNFEQLVGGVPPLYPDFVVIGHPYETIRVTKKEEDLIQIESEGKLIVRQNPNTMDQDTTAEELPVFTRNIRTTVTIKKEGDKWIVQDPQWVDIDKEREESAMRGFKLLKKLPIDNSKPWTREEMTGFYQPDGKPAALSEEVKQFLNVGQRLKDISDTKLLTEEERASRNSWLEIEGHLLTSIVWDIVEHGQPKWPTSNTWHDTVVKCIPRDREEKPSDDEIKDLKKLPSGQIALQQFWGDMERIHSLVFIQNLEQGDKEPHTFKARTGDEEKQQAAREVLDHLIVLSPDDPKLLDILQFMLSQTNLSSIEPLWRNTIEQLAKDVNVYDWVNMESPPTKTMVTKKPDGSFIIEYYTTLKLRNIINPKEQFKHIIKFTHTIEFKDGKWVVSNPQHVPFNNSDPQWDSLQPEDQQTTSIPRTVRP